MTSNSKPFVVFVLRHNISVETDVELATAELLSLCKLKSAKSVKPISSRVELIKLLNSFRISGSAMRALTRHLRQNGTVALLAQNVDPSRLEAIVKRSSFGQEFLYYSRKTASVTDQICKKLTRLELVEGAGIIRGITLSFILDCSTSLVFGRGKGLNVANVLDETVDYLLDESEPSPRYRSAIDTALKAKKTTLYLTHELHLYKGKFFPRMVRSLINRYAPSEDSVILDPFVGSGTALLESSLLNHPSIGLDVDPTSVSISSQKLTPIHINPQLMGDVCLAIQAATEKSTKRDLFDAGCYSLKNWKQYKIDAPEPMRGRLAKRGREENYDLLGQVEDDSAKVLCLIDQTPKSIQPILLVCLSHALTKKLRLRFVGIGNGRFTIDVARVGVLELFLKKVFHLLAITEVFGWLRRNGQQFSPTNVIRGSATEMSTLVAGRKFDLIVTSPPYIPASSGREHYARARAIPLVFTGAASLKQLDALDAQFIGEMSAQKDTLHREKSMPPAIRRTLEFLRGDEQRRPKYLPTLNYYVDLEAVLKQTKKCLTTNGRAIFVVAKSHTFYVHKTKKIVHQVDAAGAVAELGQKVGLKLVELLHIPLSKSGGLNARPRSTDEYSESVLVFAR